MIGKIWRWITRFFTSSGNRAQSRHAAWPTREEIEQLPPFDALGLDGIIEVTTGQQAQRAYRELMTEGVVGFDTESKPTFVKGEASTGPHVAQFSTLDRAYVFILHDPECRRIAGRLIGAEALKKVGFGLSGDLSQIISKLGVQPRAVVELATLFAAKGYGRGVGVKVGVAITLKRRFQKSKRASTSNWKQRRLTDKQILYAANDAYAAIKVFHALTPSNEKGR